MKTWQQVARMAGTMPVNQIADELCVSVDTVRMHAAKLGVSLAFYNKRWPDTDNKKVLDLWYDGMPLEKIAEALGRTERSTYVQLSKLRQRPENRAKKRVRKDPRAIPVRAVHVKTGMELNFVGLKACVEAGFIAGDISRCCRGERKTHAGYRWEYLTE